jgi:uncharacterized protein
MEKLKLTDAQKKDLLLAARYTVQGDLFAGKTDGTFPTLQENVFGQKFGMFVTVTIEGELRGCIGYIEGVKALRDAVKDMARQAAFHDPRFYPLTKEEYPAIDIEISVLYPVEAVNDFTQIQVGRDGLIMERGHNKGLLLPQVATEYGWSREEFMNQTCRKAGMESFCWENGAKVLKFEAEVFNEKSFK